MKLLAPVLLVAGCLLVLPLSASAAVYTVDSIGDQADETGDGVCKTSVSTCTLRAAIEESNKSTGVIDEIKFAAAFNGQLVDTIAIATSLPAIKDRAHIDGDSGGQCATEAGVAGPCVGVNGPAAGSALIVEDTNGVEIEGLAITGVAGGAGAAAINVINGSATLKLRDNWIGVKLDGSTTGTNNKGIFLDPESNSATIGGVNAADRNVIANNSFEGLDIEGADEADILGNYFGVKPDGATRAANGKNVEITDTITFEANNDEVGTTVEGAAATTQACDGGCNVISGSNGSGVDLVGDGEGQNELPASGPTTVSGNYVGLNSGGVTTVPTGALFDIYAGAAEDVTVGGTQAGNANYIAGGSYGIYQENSNGFQVLGNVIGRRPGGAGVSGTSTAGIFLFSLNSTGREAVEGNTIRVDGGAGIEQRFGGADIAGNSIEEGQYGILTFGSPAGAGSNVIEENTILGAELNAVLIKNENNLLVGNLIEGASLAGIRLEGAEATGAIVGGNAEAEENEISGNGGDAVEIVGEEATDNQVLRNFGSGNGGLFIDLGANGEGNSGLGPNDGIQAPSIASAKLAGANGSGALPGAEIRVFRKATASSGELESFLGEAKADGSGNWSVTYAAAIPGETQIAATQTGFEGTSELAFAKTEAAPKTGGGGGGGGGSSSDGTPPQTKITKGPKAKTHATTVKFKFSSSEAGSTFECKLDKRPFKPCRSPKKYKKLKPGKHVFKVWAIDKAGNVDPTPAKKKFKVLG